MRWDDVEQGPLSPAKHLPGTFLALRPHIAVPPNKSGANLDTLRDYIVSWQDSSSVRFSYIVSKVFWDGEAWIQLPYRNFITKGQQEPNLGINTIGFENDFVYSVNVDQVTMTRKLEELISVSATWFFSLFLLEQKCLFGVIVKGGTWWTC